MCVADSYYFDPDLDIKIQEIEAPVAKPLKEWLKNDLEITLISEVCRISECGLSIVRLDGDPLKRCAILYHSEYHGVDIVGCSQNSVYTLCEDAHDVEMFNANESNILSLITMYTELKRKGADSKHIKRRLKYFPSDKQPKRFSNMMAGVIAMLTVRYKAASGDMGKLKMDGV
jgi:hypothetical protein